MTISTISDIGLPMTIGGLKEWFYMHNSELYAWTQQNIDFDSWDDFMNEVWANKNLMSVMYYVISQNSMLNSNKITVILEEMAHKRGIYLILGAPGYGKTTLMHYLGDNLNKRYNEDVTWYGPPCKLPDHIKHQTLIMDKLPVNVTVLLDESGLQCFSRDNAQKDMIRELAVQRHSDRTWILSSQQSSISDINILRMAKGIFFLNPTTFSKGTERFIIGDELKFLIPSKVGSCMYFDNEKILIFSYPKPEWWSDEYSKPYRKFKDNSELYCTILKLIEDDLQVKEIQRQVAMRGMRISEEHAKLIMSLKSRFGSELDTLPPDEISDMIESGWDETPLNELIPRYMKNEKMVIGKPKRYNFEMTPSESAWYESKMIMQDFAVKCKTPWNMDMIRELMIRVKNDKKPMNCIVSCNGETGSGKSTQMLSLAMCMYIIRGKEMLPEDVKNIVFFSKDAVMDRFNDMLKEPNKGRNSVLILDEAGVKDIGIGSNRPNVEMNNILQTIRQRQIHFLFCSPDTTSSYDHFVARMYGVDTDEGVGRMLISKDMYTFGYITLSDIPQDIRKAYNALKEPYLDKVQSRKTSDKEYEKKAEILLDNAIYEKAKSLAEKKAVAKKVFPNTNTSEIEQIVAWANILSRE